MNATAPNYDELSIRKIHTTLHGYFSMFQNHFTFSRHLQLSHEDSILCLPGLSITHNQLPQDSGLRQLTLDSGIPGLVYLLPMSGDHITVFQLDSKSSSSNYKTTTNKVGQKGGKMKGSNKPTDFTQSGECQVIGDLHFKNIKDLSNGKDKIIQMLSLKGQLLLQTEKGRLFAMETSNID